MLEKREEEKLASHHRVFHAIGSFVGTVQFIVLQCIAVVCWIAVNGFFPDHALDSSPFLAEREATRSLRILQKIAGAWVLMTRTAGTTNWRMKRRSTRSLKISRSAKTPKRPSLVK
ncbi:hypothetical protein XH98_01380 [Bradyrhizobium sp. CCBAU 51745]|nr:hypothetical protein [Bradyrhizobium sp. CCBAU 51745]